MSEAEFRPLELSAAPADTGTKGVASKSARLLLLVAAVCDTMSENAFPNLVCDCELISNRVGVP